MAAKGGTALVAAIVASGCASEDVLALGAEPCTNGTQPGEWKAPRLTAEWSLR